MRIGRVLYPVSALGPGLRLGLWVQGCNRNCEGCANPELQDLHKADIPDAILIGMARAAIKDYNLQGITISGGEPMLQADGLIRFLDGTKDLCDDVLVFSGYTLAELKAQNNTVINALLDRVSVLVDGPYVKSLNHGELLRGSENQCIHYLKPNIREQYEEYLHQNKRVMDNFISNNGVVAVGIHPKDIIW